MINHSFSRQPSVDIQRSKFDRSHGLKTTMDADKLVPILVDEVLPGDTHTLRANFFGRLATPINPIMDNLKLTTHYFFVPMRLVWDNAEKFFGQQDDPDDSTDYIIPARNLGSSSATTGSISDYFGLPLISGVTPNILPFRAMSLIFDEWYRDQNLQNSAKIIKDDTSGIHSNVTDYPLNTLFTRGKRHDYFTSALPWAQKGDPVQVPLGDRAPIFTDVTLAGTDVQVLDTTGVKRKLTANLAQVELGGSGLTGQADLYADLETATSASINQWRQAFQIQKFLERDARGGTRYIEKIKSHFGVTNPDFRLQRPEYLGGDNADINVHPVSQTSSTDGTTPQGNLSGFGTVSSNGKGFTKSFTEHGYIIGLASVTADLTYQQGLDKLWTRRTQYDHYFPSFAHLGEQAILSKELYYDGTQADDNIFGYQERFAEYRYKRSQITGLFRSTAAASLDAWHLSQEFSSRPVLGSDFIESNTPVDRVIAVPSEPHLILDCWFDYKSVRPMPVQAPPGMIDHF